MLHSIDKTKFRNEKLSKLNNIINDLLGKGKPNELRSLFLSYQELKKIPDDFFKENQHKDIITNIYEDGRGYYEKTLNGYPIIHLPSTQAALEKIDAKKKIQNEVKEIQNSIGSYIENDFWLPKLYIPILRGMRRLDNSTQNIDVYRERTYKDYKIGESSKNETFTGLSIYYDLQRFLLGEVSKRKLVKNFEDFLSKNFFDNQEVSLIPMLDKDVVYIKIGEKELPIYELGDGVQALIILTFPLFLRKEEPHAVFIEEPELHLHPKWQRFFLKTIKEEFPNHYFFFTTHSNVFLNSKGVSIYHVTQSQEKNKSLIRYVDGHAIEALEDLGYHASDLFNTNYILWVEGISDKIYLKKFIEVFDNTLEEGIDYTIMLYGGCAQLKHFLLEAENSDAKISIPFINKNFGFCVDSDKTQKGDVLKTEKTDIKKSCEEQDKFCWITDVRETENLIPKEIWVKAAIDYAKTSKPREYEMATESDCEIPEGDWNFVDLLKTKVKRPNSSNGETLKINDKIKMAKAVTKIFPQNKENLKLTLELYDNIKQLVEKIKSVKPESNL